MPHLGEVLVFAMTVGGVQFLSYYDMLEGGCLTPEGDGCGSTGFIHI